MNIYAPAKINLTLDILGRRSDGYHDVKMIMQTVSLFDKVTLTLNDSKELTVECTNPNIPCDGSNIVCKAARCFYSALGEDCGGLHIFIEKNIPSEAGLAGGSTDGAAVFTGLNKMYGEPFSLEKLEALSAKIGADVPFCLRGGTALAEGIGTKLTSLDDIPNCCILLVKPQTGISTAAAYKAADSRVSIPESATDKMLPFLNDISKIAENLRNDFEEVVFNGETAKLKNDILACDGALGACMSGSGSTVFGIFDDRLKAAKAEEYFKSIYNDVFLTRPISHGTVIYE